jgi:hypothetical protein
VKVKVTVTVRASSKEGSTELGARFTPEPCRPSAPPPPWPLSQFQHAFPGRDFAATRAVFGGCFQVRAHVLHACLHQFHMHPPSVISRATTTTTTTTTTTGRGRRHHVAASPDTSVQPASKLYFAQNVHAGPPPDGTTVAQASARVPGGYGGTRWLP